MQVANYLSNKLQSQTIGGRELSEEEQKRIEHRNEALFRKNMENRIQNFQKVLAEAATLGDKEEESQARLTSIIQALSGVPFQKSEEEESK